MIRRKTATTSGSSGTSRSQPVFTRQPRAVLLRTRSQPPSRSTSSTSRWTASPTRGPVLARVKWIGKAHRPDAHRKASSVDVSKTKIGLSSWTFSRSSGSSEKGSSA